MTRVLPVALVALALALASTLAIPALAVDYCASLQPCPTGSGAPFCQLAVDDPTLGLCVGQRCTATIKCPEGLFCSTERSYCLACPADQKLYAAVPCLRTCDEPTPQCGPRAPGCGCPEDKPIRLRNGACGTLDQCAIAPASACRPIRGRVMCNRTARCFWDNRHKVCRTRVIG